jgi:hypothetical protein
MLIWCKNLQSYFANVELVQNVLYNIFPMYGKNNDEHYKVVPFKDTDTCQYGEISRNDTSLT